MSSSKPITHKKAAGAALVLLSGAVPQPFVQPVQAATTKLSVTGSLVTGVAITKIADIKFGKMAATAGSGSMSVTTAGAHGGSSKAVGISGEANGAIAFKVVSTTPKIDITISKMGALTLANTVGGNKTGTAKLTKILFGKQIHSTKAAVAVTVGGGTTGKQGSVTVNKKTVASMKVGAVISWGATQPMGAFGQTITITMSY